MSFGAHNGAVTFLIDDNTVATSFERLVRSLEDHITVWTAEQTLPTTICTVERATVDLSSQRRALVSYCRHVQPPLCACPRDFLSPSFNAREYFLIDVPLVDSSYARTYLSAASCAYDRVGMRAPIPILIRLQRRDGSDDDGADNADSVHVFGLLPSPSRVLTARRSVRSERASVDVVGAVRYFRKRLTDARATLARRIVYQMRVATSGADAVCEWRNVDARADDVTTLGMPFGPLTSPIKAMRTAAQTHTADISAYDDDDAVADTFVLSVDLTSPDGHARIGTPLAASIDALKDVVVEARGRAEQKSDGAKANSLPSTAAVDTLIRIVFAQREAKTETTPTMPLSSSQPQFGSLISLLAVVVVDLFHVQQLNVDSFALIWNEFVSELRFHFESKNLLPNTAKTIPTTTAEAEAVTATESADELTTTNISFAVSRLAGCIDHLLASSSASSSSSDEFAERMMIDGERILHSLETVPLAAAAEDILRAAMSTAVSVLIQSMSAAQSAIAADGTHNQESALIAVCDDWRHRIVRRLRPLTLALVGGDALADWTSTLRGLELAEAECATFCAVAYRLATTPLTATAALTALVDNSNAPHMECAVDSLRERRALLTTALQRIDDQLELDAHADCRRLFIRCAMSADAQSYVVTRACIM